MPAIDRNRVEELMGILFTGTKNKALKWDTTADENTFRLASPTANVRVSRSERYHPDAPGEIDIARDLSILNSVGRVIEEYSPAPYSMEIEKFDALFAEARRSANDTEGVLDKLMKELQKKVS